MKLVDKNYLLIIFAGSLWGTIGLFVKLMDFFGSTALFTSFSRMIFAVLIMIPITLIKEGPKAFLVDRYTLLSCLLMGLFCQALYNVFYSLAINRIGMSLSAVLLYTSPIFTSTMSFFIFDEKMIQRKRIALLINVVGCALAITGGRFSNLNLSLVGILFGLGAGFCYSMSPILGSIATKQTTPFAICTYNFFFATIFLALFTHPWTTLASPIRGELILTAIGFALIPTVCSYLLYYKGLRNIKEISKVPVFASVETVVALLIGMLVFKESIGVINGAGIALVFASILIMNVNAQKTVQTD